MTANRQRKACVQKYADNIGGDELYRRCKHTPTKGNAMRRALIVTGLAALASVALTAPANAKPVAPGAGVSAGTATVATAGFAAKGRPPVIGDRGSKAAPPSSLAALAVNYQYGSGYQYATAQGASGFFRVAQPSLAAADSHTLAELAVQSADGLQIVEIGWTVDRSLYGDALPRLFVFHWIDGIATCYNACGFVPYDAAARPGIALANGSTPKFTIQHYQGNWWIGLNSLWVGYYPDSRWGGRYTQSGLTQWFGEVAAGSATPCTDMGTGAFASSVSAATITNLAFISGPATNVTTFQTHPAHYTASRTTANSIRYGGPGAC